MKAEIRVGGELWIIAENPCEALALKHIIGDDVCEKCGQIQCNGRLTFDASALDNYEAVPPCSPCDENTSTGAES